jgi:putative sterol carrier protein
MLESEVAMDRNAQDRHEPWSSRMSSKPKTPPDPVADFMQGLAARGHAPSLARTTGTVRFEVVDGNRTRRWVVTSEQGEITVSRTGARADAVVRVPRPLCEQLVQGKANPTAAFLRGALVIEGNLALLVLVQRLFPAPAAGRRTGRAEGGTVKHP